MSNSEEKFFQYLGELWRLVLVVENLIRMSVMIENDEECLFPNKVPYKKGDVYEEFPTAYSIGFDKLLKTYDETFAEPKVPHWFAELRHALAHGMIGNINDSPEQQLIKFNTSTGKLVVEYAENLRSEDLLEKIKVLESLRVALIKHIKKLQLAKKEVER